MADARLLRTYVAAFTRVDSRDALALARQSELAAPLTRLSKLTTRFTALLGALDLDVALSASAVCREHEFPLRQLQESARHLMPPDQEALIADLHDSGTGAWGRLHMAVTSQIEVPFDGQARSMSAVRTLAYDPDSSTRRRAYEAELDTWGLHEVPLAASLNSIKCQTSLLAKKRGWGALLNESLFDAHIDRLTLDAMMSAAHAAFPVFRRYLRAKAKVLGHQGGLPWYDIFAPIGSQDTWSYSDAADVVSRRFTAFSKRLGTMADRAFREDWIDAAPMPGKVDGAFCMGVRKDESRILMNFKPSFGSVSTLAHELGHAYHNVCLADRSELLKQTPMTLAETASIFCETIIKRAAIAESSGDARLAMLDASLQGSCQTVVDITSRFLFENEVVERRADRELNPDELCDAMLRAQEATYGDGLCESARHPYMWAVKSHYYSPRPFYNYPYMFGLLFGLGLYAVFQKEPDGFQARYDQLLSETGMDTAANLASRFGIDIRSRSFWEGSLLVISEDVDDFVRLVG